MQQIRSLLLHIDFEWGDDGSHDNQRVIFVAFRLNNRTTFGVAYQLPLLYRPLIPGGMIT